MCSYGRQPHTEQADTCCSGPALRRLRSAPLPFPVPAAPGPRGPARSPPPRARAQPPPPRPAARAARAGAAAPPHDVIAPAAHLIPGRSRLKGAAAAAAPEGKEGRQRQGRARGAAACPRRAAGPPHAFLRLSATSRHRRETLQPRPARGRLQPSSPK